jgi:hypothetical protein
MWPRRSLIVQAKYGTLATICGFHPKLSGDRVMKKTLMALAAVAALAIATASPANAWRGGWGPGLAAGLIGGAIVGGAIASGPYGYGYGPGYYYGPGPYYGGPAYVADPGYGGCYWQRQRFWDGYTWRIRRVRVCG